jgi:hypothetical protein
MYPIPEAGGPYMQQYRQPEGRGGEYVSYTGSQKWVEDSMYLIPEAGGDYMQLYRQPEGGEGEGGGEYVSYT